MSEVEFINIFADNLRDSIKESGYSISEIAKKTNISKSTISRYLNKKQMPTIRAVINLSIALLCDVKDLIPDYDKIN